MGRLRSRNSPCGISLFGDQMDGHCLRQTFAPDTAGELHSTGGGGVRFFSGGGESTKWGPEPIVMNGVMSPVNMALYMGNWGSFTPISGAMGHYLEKGRGPPCRVFFLCVWWIGWRDAGMNKVRACSVFSS